MRCDKFVAETRERVRAERERMGEALSGRFEVYPSDSPFLLLDVGEQDVDELVDWARERGVAVRDATTFRGLDSHVRVAVRLPEENDRLLEVLGEV
jgi:histidinol-phosphate/aromatic aminotransferase/cobyric acid decarboxylase-like protein